MFRQKSSRKCRVCKCRLDASYDSTCKAGGLSWVGLPNIAQAFHSAGHRQPLWEGHLPGETFKSLCCQFETVYDGHRKLDDSNGSRIFESVYK